MKSEAKAVAKGPQIDPTKEETEPEVVATKIEEEQEPLLVEGDEVKTGLTELDDSMSMDAPNYLRLPAPSHIVKAPIWWPKGMTPKTLRFPKGHDVVFMRIRGQWTSAKHKGDRYVILWEVSDGDEKLAYGRGMGDPNRAGSEVAKQMIRAIDGAEVTWDGLPGPGNADQFWSEVGAKGRNQLIRMHTQLHIMDRSEQTDFFENCVAVIRTG